MNNRPGPEEKVCYNCKHMLWMVALGQGVRCGYRDDEKKFLTWIPRLRHTCDKFEKKEKDEQQS